MYPAMPEISEEELQKMQDEDERRTYLQFWTQICNTMLQNGKEPSKIIEDADFLVKECKERFPIKRSKTKTQFSISRFK